jgi:hypothetical protein
LFRRDKCILIDACVLYLPVMFYKVAVKNRQTSRIRNVEHSFADPVNHPGTGALELGWFHDLEVSFSYWHGGKLLLDGPKFQWPNETVLEDVRDEGQRLCRIYDISSTSSLELLAFRVDRRCREPSRRQTDIGTTQNGTKACRQPSCAVAISSGRRRPRGTNSSRLACSRGMLCQICTYRGYMRRGGGLARSLLCADESPRPGRHAAWAGHFDGEVSHLTIDEEPSGPGGRFIRVAGQISIATAPGSPRTSDAELLDTVALAAAIDVRPTSRDLHWDTTRLDKEQQSWSWLNP